MSSGQSLQSPGNHLARRFNSPGPPDSDEEVLEQALATFQAALTDDERTKLQQTKGSPCDAGSIIQFTHALDSQDPARRGKSMATNLYSLFQSVQQFYQIVDTYVSSHPEIAALVWGSVKLTFMVLGNFTSYFEKFSELLRGFGQLVPRFAEYQSLFPDSVRLRSATYKYQAAVIKCCSHILIATRRPWKKQLLVVLSQSFQSEMRPFIDDIRLKAKDVKGEIALAKAQADHQEQVSQAEERRQAGKTRKELGKWFSQSGQEMQGLRREELMRATERKWDALLEKLSAYDHAAAFKRARSKRHNGTAEWIFNASDFKAWYNDTKSAVLHIVGKIGCGKTVLTANVVDYLIKHRQQQSQAVAFFFVCFDDQTSQESEQVLRSIIRQVLNHGSCNDKYLGILEKSKDQFFSKESLLQLWNEIVQPFDDFFLVLDGFDECSSAERKNILDSVSKLCQACDKTTRLKALISSRGSVTEEIDRIDLPLFRLTVDASNINDDLARYAKEILDDKIFTGEFVVQDQLLTAEILDAISLGGEGMFLWVFLALEDICSRVTDPEIRKVLLNIPRKLSDTFNRALQRIMKNGKTDIAKEIFNWTATVRSPLTLYQLQEALAVEIGQTYSQPERYLNGIERLTSWCENMVHVEETDETVHFIHHSIQKYLFDISDTSLRCFQVDPEDGDHLVGEICLTYLDFNDFKKTLVEVVSVEKPSVGIADQTARNTLNGTTRGKMARLAQEGFRKSKPHAITYTTDEKPQPDSTFTLEHPFFQYAIHQWLTHTKHFNSAKSKTWNLWKDMIRSEYAPWMDPNWQPPGVFGVTLIRHVLYSDQLCTAWVRAQSLILHKAVAFANSMEHQKLIEQFFSMFQERKIKLNLNALGVLIQDGEKLLILSEDFPLNSHHLYVSHKNLVAMFTRYIASGGTTWPEYGEPWYTHSKCDNLNGIHQDICRMLKDRRNLGIVTVGKPWLQTFAKVSISDPNQDLLGYITQAFKSLTPECFFDARTRLKKTIVNLVLERGGDWSRKIATWMLHTYPTSILKRDSLRYALKTKDANTVEFLLQSGQEYWTRSWQIDQKTIKRAIKYTDMSNTLTKQFVRNCIPVAIIKAREERGLRHKRRSKQELEFLGVHASVASDECPRSDEEINAEMEVRKQVLGIAVDEDCWDVALALHELGARLGNPKDAQLRPNETVERDAYDAILDCIATRQDGCSLKLQHRWRSYLVCCDRHTRPLRSRLLLGKTDEEIRYLNHISLDILSSWESSGSEDD
nr:nacht domain protein [Colletotrichum truncatum]KAF6790425.1 nacht domain protein [Colletotrichum truncatum]